MNVGKCCALLAMYLFAAVSMAHSQSSTSKKDSVKPRNLIFPMLLEKEKRLAGNPLATYASIVDLENEYSTSPFSPVYDEIRYNFEQFLGFPDAGKKAMSLPQFKASSKGSPEQDLTVWSVVPVMKVIKEEAEKTRVVIWAEEHHMPQTRALFEEMLKTLWGMGYRYLAAEAFSEGLRDSTLKYINYHSGFYTQDPVFASAVNEAIRLGFKLVDYDTKETSATEPSHRDIKQAENIYQHVLKNDPTSKILIIVGRGHGSEIESGGWKPMAYNLKKISGIDPFTLMTQTMTERVSQDEEHPLYRQVTRQNLLNEVSVLKNKNTGQYLSSGAFDAYVFFPRTKIIKGRPDWMFHLLKRKEVAYPFKNVPLSEGFYLVQAFYEDQPASSIPADQFLVTKNDQAKSLALKPGNYQIRIIDRHDSQLAQKSMMVR